MKKIFKSSKAKGKDPAPESAGGAAFDSPGYSLKEKDLPKLHKSAWTGELAKVQQLSKKGDVNQLDKGNRTALHLACSQGHKEIAAFLVSNKAKLNLCDNDQRSPLMKAAQGNHVTCVETLLRSSADPNLVDKDGNTTLHLGARGGFVDVVLLLLRGGAMVNAPNKRGSTPLHLCTEAKQDVMVEVLLDNDADVNATDNNNSTALMLACQTDQIGLVKLLLSRKADTEIKDSKGWTANDQAIMAGYHGCSHLIDEANSSRRPRSAVGRPGSSMFGSTAGSEGVGLGFSLGGGSARNEYDDDEDELSVGKNSLGEDSWPASASEVDEPVKPKPKVSKAVKLSKFIVESDDESIRSVDASQRSTASKSRIPRVVSKDSLANAHSASRGANQDASSSKIPRLAGSKVPNPTAATVSPSKAKAATAGKSQSVNDPDPWDDTPTPTPRDDDPPVNNFAAVHGGRPLTPRSSTVSFGESGNEWDDDDVLGTLEGTSPKKTTNVTQMEQPISAKLNDQVEKRPRSSQDKQQRKDVLNELGISDVDDDEEDVDSSLHFTDEEPEKPSLVKQNLKPNPIIKADDRPVVLRPAKTSAGDEEDEESDWDSDTDLLPSNASNSKDPPIIRPGDSGIQTNSNSLALNSKPVSSPRVERKLPLTPSKEVTGKGEDSDWKESGQGEAKGDEQRGDEVINDDDDDDNWDSDEDDEEEESEWEKAKKTSRRTSGHEEIRQAQKTEVSRQQQWEQEEAEREKKRKLEAEEELRREQEEIQRERQQREEEEQEKRERKEGERQERERREADQKKEDEKTRQEAEKREREREREAAEQRQRDEERRVAEEKRQQGEHLQRLEQEMREKQTQAERQLDERRKREDKERKADKHKRQQMEEERLKKVEYEMQEKQKEEERLREEKRRQEEMERKRREEELRQEMEKMKTGEERNEAERLHLEGERRLLNEDRQQEESRREEDKKRREAETKIELERIEAERAKLDTERRMMEKRQEEERKKNEDAQRLEKQTQEEARRKRDEERRRNEDERRRLEEEKEELKTLRLEQEEAKQRLEDDQKREKDRRRVDESKMKREEERLEMERKRIEEEAKKRQSALLQGMSSKSEGEKKQLEVELQRIENERQQETQRRVEEFEEEKRRQAAEKLALQKELELQSQQFKEERQKIESRQKEAERQRQLVELRREEELKQVTEERMREMEQLKIEKLRLQKENQDIEHKWQEIKMLKQEVEKKDPERYLQRYQRSIERRLQDEESNDAVTADGDHDHSSDIDADLHEMEAAGVQRQQQDGPGTGPVPSGGRRRNTNISNGLDSQGNTAEFNQGLIGHSPQNPLHSTAAVRSLRLTNSTLTNGNLHGLYSKQPAWQAILNEPDGLDSSSTDEDDDDVNGEGPATASFLSTYLTSTPQGLNTNQNAGGTASADSPMDPTAILRLQGQLREQKRIADREKSLRANAENHCKALEADIDEIRRRVDEANHGKASQDQQVLDLEARVRTLEHELSQELEKRHNAEVILDKTKEQLLRKEDQYAFEIEAKQKTELGSRNLSLELRTAQNLVRQFEEERDELRSQLLHEKHARTLQEELVQDQLYAQDALHQETSRFFSEKAEAVSRLEAADESRKNVLNQSDRLKTELNALRVELERQRMRHRDDQGMLTSENEELANKIEELKNEIRVSEEALAHATMAYNSQLMAVKTENAMLHGAVEKEMNKADKLKTKLESVDRRLQSTSQELEGSQQARSELERSLQRERDEWGRGRDKLQADIISLREAAQIANKKYTSTESKLRTLEKELQVTGTSLMERSNQLASLQRELDSRNTRQSSHDNLLQKEKEDNYKISARMESLMERLNESQNETAKLRRSLETAQQEKTQRDKDLMDAQEKFNNTIKTLQAENDRIRSAWEDRVSTSSDNIARLKEELQRSEHNRSLRDQETRQIKQDLTDALRKLSIAEANLDLARKTQNELDKEKQQQAHHMKQLQDQTRSAERDRRSLEMRIEDLQSDLMQTQRNNLNTSQQLMVTQTSLQKKSELEERLRDLEADNARLVAVVHQEKERSNSMEKEVKDSNKMRVSLEDLVSNLQTTSMRMEGKLQEETTNRSVFAKEAEDHRGLWEMEVKSRSRLGLRIAQLERAKTEVQAQVDEEKKKVRKMAEIKRSYEERWQNEVQRTQLQEQDINTLKSKLKAAKKKLKDLDAPELRLNTLQTGFERERLNMEAAVATQRRQIDDLNQQLEREASLRVDSEKQNRYLQQEMSSAKTHEKGKDKLEKSKRKLEEEFTQMKLLVQQNFIEKGELEKYKQQLDATARMELNEKLDQVNTYLEEQSQAREKLEVLRNSNENELRKEQENTMNDLKNEIGRLRSSYHDMLAQKETMEVEVARFKELYQEAVKKLDKLAAQLEKAQDKLVDSQAKFTLQKQRNRQMLDGSLDLSPSHLPKKQAQSLNMDSITEKVWSELDKSITRHLQAAPTDLGSSLTELRASALSRSYDGYNSPLRHENNQYLATLRKNYFV